MATALVEKLVKDSTPLQAGAGDLGAGGSQNYWSHGDAAGPLRQGGRSGQRDNNISCQMISMIVFYDFLRQ